MSETVTYGPFSDGYVAAQERTRIGRMAFSEDSIDVGVDPVSLALTNRPGSDRVYGESATPAGMLESKWNARARQTFSLESESFVDLEPNVACLLTDDTDKEGALVWRSTNGGDSYQQIGKSYGTTHRATAVNTPWHFLMIPIRTEHATDKWTRCKNAAQRKVLFGGSRRIMRVGKGVMAPNRFGTPLWWNGRFNDDAGAGSETEFVRPLGPIPPVCPIRRSGAPATSAGTWLGTDRAYWSYAYVFESGDISAPMLCVAGDTITVSTGVATAFPYIDVIVPPGPPDVVARLLFRTNKWHETTGTPEDPAALLLTGTILNNTQTTYRDYGGDDGSLRERPDLVRFNLIMPPRARTCWTMDGRIVFGDLAINPAVIVMCPYYINGTLTDTLRYDAIGAYAGLQGYSFWRNDGTNLELTHTPQPPGASTTDHTLALAGATLNDIVNSINTTGVGTYGWRAQLLPGADGNAPASDLETSSGSDYFDDDAQANRGANTGSCRVIYGQGLPAVLFLKNTSAHANAGTDRRAVHFTFANPSGTGTATDAPLGPNSWLGGFDCRRRVEGGMGRILGGGSLLDGSLVVLTNGVAVLRNVRGGKTGIDTDYRMEKWKQASGGIAWSGIADGDGWVCYMTRKGLMVNDGKREVCVSTRVWNHKANNGSGRGPWGYEIGECKKSVGADNDGCHMHVAVANGRIYVSYRSSGSASYPDRYMYYDYSASLNELGVDQVLRQDGTPYAWSAPCTVPVSAVGVVTRSDGDHVYGLVDGYYTGATGDGRLLEIDVAAKVTDGGATGVAAAAYLQCDRFEGLLRQKKSVTKIDVEQYSLAGEVSVSAATDFARATTTLMQLMPAVTDGTISDIARLRMKSPLHGPLEQLELKIHATPTGRFEVRQVDAEFRRLATTAP